MRLFIVAALMAAFSFVAPAIPAGASSCYGTCEGHNPHVNAQGFVIDGTPQNDDAHCVGTTDQRLACLLARRPDCRHWVSEMSNAVAMDCWAPEVNLYPWNHQDAFDALYCESKGEEGAWTHGPYKGLMQSDHGTGDATHDLNEAFYEKYRGQGPSAWSETWGRDC